MQYSGIAAPDFARRIRFLRNPDYRSAATSGETSIMLGFCASDTVSAESGCLAPE